MCTGLSDPGPVLWEEGVGQVLSSPNVGMGQGVELEYTVKFVCAPKALSGRWGTRTSELRGGLEVVCGMSLASASGLCRLTLWL